MLLKLSLLQGWSTIGTPGQGMIRFEILLGKYDQQYACRANNCRTNGPGNIGAEEFFHVLRKQFIIFGVQKQEDRPQNYKQHDSGCAGEDDADMPLPVLKSCAD